MSDLVFKNIKEIKNWLNGMNIKNYSIKDDLTVDVYESVNLNQKNLTHFPIQFGLVFGNFDCSFNYLTSLKGAPLKVFDFECDNNYLKSLEHSPQLIKGVFSFSNNLIQSLNHCSHTTSSIYSDFNPIQIKEPVDIMCSSFSHVCHKEIDKIELFKNSYTYDDTLDYFWINININDFNEEMAKLKINGEKNQLDLLIKDKNIKEKAQKL